MDWRFVIDCDGDTVGYLSITADNEIKSFDVISAHSFSAWIDYLASDGDMVELISYAPTGYDKRIIAVDSPNVVWRDVLALARKELAQDEKFKRFCTSHGYVTRHGKYSYRLECVYRYLNHTTKFYQRHDALDDATALYEILCKL